MFLIIRHCTSCQTLNKVITCNVGVDMLMEPHNWKETINVIVNAVENGDISMDRS